MDVAMGAERAVAFSTVFNFRDLGGLVARDGRVVRRGLAFRSDGLNRLEGDDLQRFADLGVRTVIDLRTSAERDLSGWFAAEGVATVHHPVLREVWDPAVVDLVDEPAAFLVERYAAMLEEGGRAIAATLELLAIRGALPVAFHCSAGKDRTGVVAALLLALLGVDDGPIARDYEESATGMEQLAAWHLEHFPDRADAMAGQPAVFWTCPSAAMHLFLDRVRTDHGSVDGYLRSVGVDAGVVDALRATFLG